MAVEGQSSTKYDLNSFRWSEEEYSLRELIERFGHQLPFLVTATAGYMGIEDWLGGVATNEVSSLLPATTSTRNTTAIVYTVLQ